MAASKLYDKTPHYRALLTVRVRRQVVERFATSIEAADAAAAMLQRAWRASAAAASAEACAIERETACHRGAATSRHSVGLFRDFAPLRDATIREVGLHALDVVSSACGLGVEYRLLERSARHFVWWDNGGRGTGSGAVGIRHTS